MAIYGIDYYGVGTYGQAAFVEFDASPFTATPMDYDKLFLEWRAPTGTFSSLRLVRNPSGIPAHADDGTVLFESASAPITWMDASLPSGQFQYYSIFVLSGTEWKRAGSTVGLVSRDYGSADRMYYLLPAVYRGLDSDTGEANEQLQRFLGIFGYQVDHIRNEYDTLLHVNNANKMSGNLLPLAAKQYGFTYEEALGQHANRRLLANMARLYKLRGTRLGIEALTTALTNRPASVTQGKNLMLDYNQSSFEEGMSTWTSLNGEPVTFTRGTTSGLAYANTAGTNKQAGYGSVTATGAVTNWYLASCPTANVITQGIPVSPSTVYTASVYFRSAATPRTHAVYIEWCDKNGNVVGNTDTTGTATTTTGWTRDTSTGTSPATAAYARIILYFPTMANGEVQYFDAVQFEQGSAATEYEDARDIKVNLTAERTNLVPNPSFEVNTTKWEGLNKNILTADKSNFEGSGFSWFAGYNIQAPTRTTDLAKSGSYSLRLVSNGAGTYMSAAVNSGGPGTITPGEVYQATAFVRSSAASRKVQLTLDFFDAAGNYIAGYSRAGQEVASTPYGWTQATCTAVAPPTASQMNISAVVLNPAAAGEIFFIDEVGLFRAPRGNLIPNSDFENGITTGWGVNAGTLTVATGGYAGRNSMRWTHTSATAAGSDIVYCSDSNLALVPGTQGTASMYVYPSVTTSLRAAVYHGAAGYTYGSTVSCPANTWTRLTVTYTANANGSNTITLNAPSGTVAGFVVRVDAVQLVVGTSALPFVPAESYNLIQNPSFVTDTSDWFGNLVTLTRDSSGLFGAGSLKAYWDGNPGDVHFTTGGTVLLAPNTTYTASFYVKTDTDINWNVAGYVGVVQEAGGSYRDATNGVIANRTITVSQGWTRITQTFTTLGDWLGTSRLVLRVPNVVGNSGLMTSGQGNWWLDGFQIELGAEATPFIDGTLGAGYENLISANENILQGDDVGFEGGTVGSWQINAAGTIASSTDISVSGSRSAKYTANAGSTYAGVARTGIPVAPNTTYTFSVWVYVPGGTAPRTVDALVSGPGVAATIVGTRSSAYESWRRLQVTFTTNSTNNSTINIVVSDNTGTAWSAGQAFYIDEAWLTVGPEHRPYHRRRAPWVVGGSQLETMSRQSNRSISGTYSLVPQANHVANNWSRALGVQTDPITVSPSTTYVASAYTTNENGVAGLTLSVVNADTEAVLGSVVLTPSQGAGTFARRTWTFTTGASTTRVRLRVAATSVASIQDAIYFYLDAVQLEKGSTATPYFDGSTESSTTGNTIWEGTAHDSRSFYYSNRRVKVTRLNALLKEYTPLGSSYTLVYAPT